MKLFKAIAILHFSFSILHSYGAVIDQVIVRQQWPWSTDVKIEYRLSQVTNPVDITVRAYNGTTPLDNTRIAGALSGNRYGVTESVGTIILDPIKAFGNDKVAIADFRVELELTESAANTTEVVYKIFDLVNGGCQDVTRADFYNGKMGDYETNFKSINPNFADLGEVLIWTAVTNNVEYSTTKLVMRKVNAKNVTFTMGSPSTEPDRLSGEDQHEITLSKDYYIGVYPLTVGQAKCFFPIVNNAGSAMYPAQGASPIQQLYITLGMLYPSDPTNSCPLPINTPIQIRGAEGSTIVWPTDGHAVDSESLLKKMRDKLGVMLEMPTEAEWEYACRAGTTSAYYSGLNNYNLNVLTNMCWYDVNSGNRVHQVGRKQPNAFGLYDMIGNIYEGCLDYYVSDTSTLPATDVGGPASGTSRVLKGGCATYYNKAMRSAHRSNSIQNGLKGTRLVLEVD